jgi:methionine synthase II (cobalamin-independent)
VISDHRFEPRVESVLQVVSEVDYYDERVVTLPPNEYLCQDCGLAESAHETARGVLPLALKFRCPACVEAGAEVCPHG